VFKCAVAPPLFAHVLTPIIGLIYTCISVYVAVCVAGCVVVCCSVLQCAAAPAIFAHALSDQDLYALHQQRVLQYVLHTAS